MKIDFLDIISLSAYIAAFVYIVVKYGKKPIGMLSSLLIAVRIAKMINYNWMWYRADAFLQSGNAELFLAKVKLIGSVNQLFDAGLQLLFLILCVLLLLKVGEDRKNPNKIGDGTNN